MREPSKCLELWKKKIIENHDSKPNTILGAEELTKTRKWFASDARVPNTRSY